jgi:hypothetical protein
MWTMVPRQNALHVEQGMALLGFHLVNQVAGLLIVIIIDSMVRIGGCAPGFQS